MNKVQAISRLANIIIKSSGTAPVNDQVTSAIWNMPAIMLIDNLDMGVIVTADPLFA